MADFLSLDEQQKIIYALSNTYYTMHLLDLSEDRCMELSSHHLLHDSHEISGEYISDGQKVLNELINELSGPEYMDLMLCFINLSTINRRLAKRNELSVEFISKNDGWIAARFIKVSSEKDEVMKVIFVTKIIEAERKREELLVKTSTVDEISGLLNRHSFEQDITEIQNSHNNWNYIFVSLDVNGLKVVNDTLGHAAGDELIRGAAECISKTLGSYGKVYRIGGDEFAAILFVDDSKVAAIRRNLKETVEAWSGVLVDSLAISSGFVSKTEYPDYRLSEMEAEADARMYQEKEKYYKDKGIDRRGQKADFAKLYGLYVKMMKINLIFDSYHIIKIDENESSVEKECNGIFTDWISKDLKLGYIHPDDIDEFRKTMDLEWLKTYFASGNSYLRLHYKRKINDEYKPVLLELVLADESAATASEIYLYIKDIS